MRRAVATIALALALCPIARGQEPVITYPAGAYTITTPAATTIERGVGYVTLRWGAGPAPVPPAPVPTPTPTPDPVPVPVVTGHAWILLIHDPASPVSPSAATQAIALQNGITIQALPSTDATAAGWVAKAKNRVPLVVVVQPDPANAGKGILKHEAAMPADADAGLLDLVHKLKGQ